MVNIKEIIKNLITHETDWQSSDFQIEKPKSNYGDYAVGVFVTAKKEGRPPQEVADEVAQKLNADKPEEFERIEAVGGYVNFFLSRNYLQLEFSKIIENKKFGLSHELKGKTIMVEYTDANPFKLFHIGHLMTNTIGESIARLYEASGAKVVRANYQGDVGLHVAKAIWAVKKGFVDIPDEKAPLPAKVQYLGASYAAGATAYEEGDPETKKEIEEINTAIYNRSDEDINRLYDLGRKWSLEYFEEIYARLGTKFDEYFFESQAGKDGLELVEKNKKVFTESDGAIIFRGENYGLHTRVFINSKGLPTYEAKELGLNKKKFDLYPLELSIIVTGNEITEYFKVLLKAMELITPEIAQKTHHVPHGMLRLPTGKMSSRTGEVITADSLLEQIQVKLSKIENENSNLSVEEKENNLKQVAIGAIKYSILKQGPGRDVVFDFDKSLSIEGDSGPYLQYTYARLNSILAKSGTNQNFSNLKINYLEEKSELNLMKHCLEFPDVVSESAKKIAPNHLALYVFQLANLANSFYEKNRILTDENEERKIARLALIKTVAEILKRGLGLLGIQAPNRI